MPLQNRVDPFGDIHAVPNARHVHRQSRHHPRSRHEDAAQEALGARRPGSSASANSRAGGASRWAATAPGGNAGWTELFFLDEVTALAAGHRPCFYCRREAAKEFVQLLRRSFRRRRAARRRDRRAAAHGAAGVGRRCRRRDRSRGRARQRCPTARWSLHGGRCLRAAPRQGAAPGRSAGYGDALDSSTLLGPHDSGSSRRRPPSRSCRRLPAGLASDGRGLDARPPACLGTVLARHARQLQNAAAVRAGRPRGRRRHRADPQQSHYLLQRAAARRRRASCSSSTAATANGWRGVAAKSKKAVRLSADRADAAAAAASRSRLLLRAAEAGPARLSRAEGGRDGRRRAAAGDHPAHAGRQGRHRPAARQRDRGGRAMRHPGRSRGAARRSSSTALLCGLGARTGG